MLGNDRQGWRVTGEGRRREEETELCLIIQPDCLSVILKVIRFWKADFCWVALRILQCQHPASSTEGLLSEKDDTARLSHALVSHVLAARIPGLRIWGRSKEGNPCLPLLQELHPLLQELHPLPTLPVPHQSVRRHCCHHTPVPGETLLSSGWGWSPAHTTERSFKQVVRSEGSKGVRYWWCSVPRLQLHCRGRPGESITKATGITDCLSQWEVSSTLTRTKDIFR